MCLNVKADEHVIMSIKNLCGNKKLVKYKLKNYHTRVIKKKKYEKEGDLTKQRYKKVWYNVQEGSRDYFSK